MDKFFCVLLSFTKVNNFKLYEYLAVILTMSPKSPANVTAIFRAIEHTDLPAGGAVLRCKDCSAFSLQERTLKTHMNRKRPNEKKPKTHE